jgi:hypothetical protein
VEACLSLALPDMQHRKLHRGAKRGCFALRRQSVLAEGRMKVLAPEAGVRNPIHVLVKKYPDRTIGFETFSQIRMIYGKAITLTRRDIAKGELESAILLWFLGKGMLGARTRIDLIFASERTHR